MIQNKSDYERGNPTVSVIIPTYNRQYLVQRAINSVLGQTYENFELLVVDDGSSDDTPRIVQGYEDERIKFFRHEHNKGACTARNTALERARGDYIAILGSDDIWLPDKLEKQLEAFAEAASEVGVIYTGMIKWHKSQKATELFLPKKSGDLYEEFLTGNVLGPAESTALIKSECFEEVGYYDSSLPSRQDLDMWIRISRLFKFDYVSECLARIMYHQKTISKNLDAKIEGRRRLFEKLKGDLSAKPEKKALYNYGTGIYYLRNGQINKGRQCLYNSLKSHVTQKALLATILSFCGKNTFEFVFHAKSRVRNIVQCLRRV